MAYLWGRRLYGPRPALLGAALVAFSPNLLAHARLATEDLGCTTLFFAAVWTFWRGTQRPSIPRWMVCGAMTGLACISKYTSLLLGPTFFFLVVALWARRHPFARDPKSVFLAFLVIGGVVFLVIGAGYHFSFGGSLYLKGLRSLYGDLVHDYQWYFMGTFSKNAYWYYALGAFLMKTPVSSLLLLVAAGGVALLNRSRDEATLFLLIPAVLVIGASFFDSGNFGLRRILPALPFLWVFTSQTLAGYGRFPNWIFALVLVGWSGGQTLSIHPHYLSYFNAAVGGPKSGPSLLDDSNIDWGQDLPALADWQRANPEAGPLRLMYFGVADPAAYHVNAVPMTHEEIFHPPPGTYAISAHHLVRFKLLRDAGGNEVDWLKRFEPIATAGWSIYLFHFESQQTF